MTEKPPKSPRAYPAVYEKVVPIAIGVLVLLVTAMLVFAILVGVGAINFG